MIRSPAMAGILGPEEGHQEMNKTFALLAVTSISIGAHAEETHDFYGSLGGGVYRLESSAFDDTAPALKLIGGYSFTDFFALEAGYARLFESEDTVDDVRARIDGNLWDLAARISYPASGRLSPFGRLGWSYLDSSATLRDADTRIRLSDEENAFSWAVGAAYKLNERLAVRGEYGAVMIDDGDLDSITVNVSYGFGSL